MEYIMLDDLTKMRLGVIRELKTLRQFFDHMERNVRTRDPHKVIKAYTFLCILVDHMESGDLTPTAVELHQELTRFSQDSLNDWEPDASA